MEQQHQKSQAVAENTNQMDQSAGKISAEQSHNSNYDYLMSLFDMYGQDKKQEGIADDSTPKID